MTMFRAQSTRYVNEQVFAIKYQMCNTRLRLRIENKQSEVDGMYKKDAFTRRQQANLWLNYFSIVILLYLFVFFFHFHM